MSLNVKAKDYPEGYEGCKTPWDLGWKHGTEDIHDSFKYRPGINLNRNDLDEYKDGYKEARRGWN